MNEVIFLLYLLYINIIFYYEFYYLFIDYGIKKLNIIKKNILYITYQVFNIGIYE